MKKVKIEMINHKHEEEPIEVVYIGEIDKQGKKCRVSYDESVLTGMEGVTTEIFIEDEQVEIIRKGNIESRMLFKENYKDVFLYHMEVGTMTMSLQTDKLDVIQTSEGFEISMKYSLLISGDQKDQNEMQINISKP
ncbi:MAG: DUF1934 domain-containing protein [Clostridium sp.]|nr:DUF1934 domain-containing protein [Clostridium sp.]